MAARKPGKAKPAKDKRGRPRKSNRKSPMSAGEKKLAQEREEGAAITFNTEDTEDASELLEAMVPETRMGRPPKYDPKYAVIARKMCAMGATDADLAEAFEVSIPTVRRWQVTHTDFCSAVKVQAGEFDDRVKRSLAQRAVGYSYKATKVMQYEGSPVTIDYIEHVPPDVGAIKHWLMNRDRANWTGDRADVNLSGTVETKGDVSAMDVARWIAFTLAKAEHEKSA